MKSKSELVRSLVQTDEDRLFLSRLLDKAEMCQAKCIATHTKFMDLHQRAIAESALGEFSRTEWFYHGGAEDAERCIIVFLPDYLTKTDVIGSEDDPLIALRALRHKEDELAHRDYLGALMGLGIEREYIGDIFVHGLGADIIVLKDMADFLLLHFDKAGRKHIELSPVPFGEIMLPEADYTEVRDTVASLRLDAVCAMIFSLSRAKASEHIDRGLVFLNFQQCVRSDKEVTPGDRISIRGKGKAEICELLGESRKGRLILSVKKYQ